LSKPELEDNPSKTRKQLKQERNKKYYPRFQSVDTLQKHIQSKVREEEIKIDIEEVEKLARTVAKIKLSDRIHNLKTMPLKLSETDAT